MIFSIGWRNVWRNKLRSLVVVVAITLGLMAGVFSAAFIKGWMGQRMDSVLNTEMSYIQVHHPDFKENYEFKLFIDGTDEMLKKILSTDGVAAASKRLVVNSMVASAETGTGVMIRGVEPEAEKKVTDIYSHIIEGAYFDGIRKNPVVIGEKLAKKLGVEVRKKIVITLQDAEGNIISGAFRVAGIYKTSNTAFDGSNIFVRYQDLAKLAGIDHKNAHEIAVTIDGDSKLEEITTSIAAINPKMLTENWKTLSPEMAYMDDLMGVYTYMIIITILAALCFAIINTMLMAVLERTKEIGMLMAVGMNKGRVFSMLMMESIFLTLSGGILGIILGFLATALLAKQGLDLSIWAEGLEEMGFAAIIYPEIDLTMIIPIILLVTLTGVVSSIYPAYRALKLNPTEAIRTE